MLHYPAFSHYDVLQGLRVLAAVDWLGDPRAADALHMLELADSVLAARGARRLHTAAP